jgi:cytochrome c biogenesis protein CcmG, thiol:disulfide interchange protein DsbE
MIAFYYRNVRSRSSKALGSLFLLCCLAAGCDRGTHPSQIDQVAPTFTIHDAGQTVSLDQYRGKIVVLNFWASWCLPCKAEFPSLMQLQGQIPNLVVLAVSFDTDDAAYRQYIVNNRLTNMTIIRDDTQQSNLAYGTTRPPETFIIDKQGHIRRKFIGAQDWTDPEVDSYLKNL